MEIKIKYLRDIDPIEKIEQGDWIDLRAAERVSLLGERLKLIPLGVAMELPSGYEAHVVPRSSTFKNFGVIQANSFGVIDESYCGDNDEWFFPVYLLDPKGKFIPKGSRICQFRIIKKQPKINFKVVQELLNKDRGGHGSTGR